MLHTEAWERHHRKRCEYERLNETNEEFKPEERERSYIRDEERDNSKKDLSRKDVSEQPKWEWNNLCYLADDLKNAGERGNRTPEGYEFANVAFNT